ncbi:hypothetical protein [Campylobacter ureolyticus]|uniref:hypothetical protein n=1 Tax=Campylobacter ureolyticus TaxID=827 RepID=UPI0020B11C0D|nr:hypothetical protein [Campylobacter ureolyticus]
MNYALNDEDFLNSLSSFDLEIVEKVKKLYLEWFDEHKFSENRFEELRAFMRKTLQNSKNLEIFKRLD